MKNLPSHSKRCLRLLLLLALIFIAGISVRQDVQARSYTIYVNRKTNIVNVVNRKTGKLVRAMYCSTGKNYGTISGTYHTYEKLRWHALNGGVYGQYCTRISGPYLFHSVPYYRTSHSQVETKEYNKLGKQASQGCVRLAVVDAKWIYDHCKTGTKVVISEKKKLKKPTRKRLKISTRKKAGWDPTDPDEDNPYYPTLKLTKKSYRYVALNSSFDPRSVITVSSDFTSKKTLLSLVKISGKVNTAKAGKYKIVYSLKDPATELRKKLTVYFIVK